MFKRTNNPRKEKAPLLGPGRTFLGKLWRGVLRGNIDGIPFVGPVVTAISEARQGEVIRPAARVLSSSITIVVMIGLAAERIWGDASWDDIMWLLARILFGV